MVEDEIMEDISDWAREAATKLVDFCRCFLCGLKVGKNE